MSEFFISLVRIATLAISPLIILYAFVVSTSGNALTMRAKRFLLACALLGTSQILVALGNAYKNGLLSLFGDLAFLAGMFALFVILEIRSQGHLKGRHGD